MPEHRDKKPIRRICAGLLAHVDAGKTTLSEAMLYCAGQLRRLGRVDHGDAFLDADALERERGITIFSKQAILPLGEGELTLLDTPGHVDFSAEMERTLQAADCAILVISGPDGVQSHTETLWRLLERYHLPTLIFVNKMDLPGADRAEILRQLRTHLGEQCADLSHPSEETALCDEELLEEYLSSGTFSTPSLARAVARRTLCPCWFGSALRLEGVEELLRGLEELAPAPVYPELFGARVYKISRDGQGARLTWLKVTGGALSVKDTLIGRTGREDWSEKADQLRLYSGAKYRLLERAEAGTLCAVTGLSHTFPGQGLGIEAAAGTNTPVLTPALTYQVLLPPEIDVHTALQKLRMLEEEDPQLHLVWRERVRELHVQLMGPVQREVLARQVLERFGWEVSFGPGHVVYRETIAAPVVGVGHFEPLRHYAEVHLLLEPGERGSGLVFDTACREEALSPNWQRLILSQLEEELPPGVLTGSPLTDLKITLLTGRAHPKHTQGGDFRQAACRALRQGLRRAETVLIEPWYDLRLELPPENVGRAMNDLQQRGGTCQPLRTEADRAVLEGSAPVDALGDYAAELLAYTRGRGRMTARMKGYFPCANQEAVAAAIGYDCDADTEYPADSVFCAHGAGYVVRWDEVPKHQHLETPLTREREEERETPPRRTVPSSAAEEKELQAIFEHTYGPVRRKRAFEPARRQTQLADHVEIRPRELVEEYLLVDGYNIIFAWDDLKRLARESMDRARQTLMDDLCSFQAVRHVRVILVFDAYRVKGGARRVERYHNIHVVYTQEAETADQYIEQASYRLGKRHRVRVATSDGLEQIIVLGHGCLRVSAEGFRQEMDQVKAELAEALRETQQRL